MMPVQLYQQMLKVIETRITQMKGEQKWTLNNSSKRYQRKKGNAIRTL
jgi:hypothetical protein